MPYLELTLNSPKDRPKAAGNERGHTLQVEFPRLKITRVRVAVNGKVCAADSLPDAKQLLQQTTDMHPHS